MSPEKMIDLVMSGKGADFTLELLAGFENGFPIKNLRRLLLSDDQEVVSFGSYLIYELGGKARDLLDDIIELLKNDDSQVRGYAIVAIGECATKFDALALGKVIELLADPDPFVQRIAMRFIQSCEREMLNVGVLKAAQMNPGSIYVELHNCINKVVSRIRCGIPISARNLEKLLSHKDPVAIRFGVGLATRPRLIVDLNFVDLASQIDDEECRNMVKWAHERPCVIWAETMRL